MPAKSSLQGINLGGWLVLEEWITPSVFAGTQARDESTLSSIDPKRINKFRSAFITKQDFKWIGSKGLQAVRLPVGHWVFGGFDPYVPSEKHIDKAFEWAKEYNLQILLDLHGAPGSQNGYMHSGKEGEAQWHLDSANIAKTLDVIGKLCKKYGRHPNLYGFEILNEPAKEIPLSVLQNFYRQAYTVARKHCAARVKIIFSDAYRPSAEWQEFINDPAFKNVLLDMHMYQIHYDRDRALSLEEHIAKAFKWKNDLQIFGPGKVVVGEWSAALHETYGKMTSAEVAKAIKVYKLVQEYAFENTAGYFYWNYKTENDDLWNYRHCASL